MPTQAVTRVRPVRVYRLRAAAAEEDVFTSLLQRGALRQDESNHGERSRAFGVTKLVD